MFPTRGHLNSTSLRSAGRPPLCQSRRAEWSCRAWTRSVLCGDVELLGVRRIVCRFVPPRAACSVSVVSCVVAAPCRVSCRDVVSRCQSSRAESPHRAE
jgi:hypothetical protein